MLVYPEGGGGGGVGVDKFRCFRMCPAEGVLLVGCRSAEPKESPATKMHFGWPMDMHMGNKPTTVIGFYPHEGRHASTQYIPS